MKALIQRYAGLSVPRYTSYPTAVAFSAAVGPDDKARWLETLDRAAPVSLYLHVPYCRAICHYCGCTTKATRRDSVLAAYRTSLAKEIALTGTHLLRPPRVAHLHWGGGTPSMLGAERLGAILETLAGPFAFAPGFEHAIELDPRDVTPALARALARIGVNRASLGVQDLDPAVQAAIGRVQPQAVVEAAIGALREAGIVRLNVDLIYGLPLQTETSVADTARQVAAFGVDRVACYGYAHLPRRKRNQRLIDAAALPDAGQRFAQAQAIAAAFAAAGYEAIGIDHFARPGDALAAAARAGRLNRNFQGYTDDDCTTLIGLGASAISAFAEGFTQAFPSTDAYAFALGRGRLPVVRGHRLTEDDRLRGAVIRQLMCTFRADLAGAGAPGGFSDELALLRPMIADGLATVSDGVLAMTALGRPFVRVVAAVFDAFRQGAPQAFSVAV